MDKEKDFFKTCFDTVAGLEVKNESQAIAKEVVLNEIENLEQQAKKQKEVIDRAIEYIKEKQKIQYKFALSQIECDYLLEILEGKEVSE